MPLRKQVLGWSSGFGRQALLPIGRISSGKRDDNGFPYSLRKSQLKYPCVSWFRIPTIWGHGIPGNWALVSREIRRAASPTISIPFTRDNRSIRSFNKIFFCFAFGKPKRFLRRLQHVA